MASFQKRGKTWQYTISRMIDGKSSPIRKGGFRTKAEAQAAATEIESKLNKGLVPHLKPVIFHEYFADWVSVYKSTKSESTKARYNNSVETVKAFFPGVNIQDIGRKKYQSVLNEYAKTHAKASTKKLNSHIRACVKDAIDEGIIFKDFTRNVTVSGDVPTKRPEDKHLNYFESKLLVRYMTENLTTLTRYLVILGLASGARFGELVGLTRSDFDFTRNLITINKTWGYAKKMHRGFGPTKNEASVRKIKIDQHTMDLFKELFANTPPSINGLVFYSPLSKYQCISNNAVNKELKTAAEKLKIKKITVHGLRHTHASILLYKRASIYYVSQRLGHEDINTTLQTYAHVLNELKAEDDKINDETFLQMYA